jgi:MFS family permease
VSITTPPDHRPPDPTPDDRPFAGVPEVDPVVDPVVDPEAHGFGLDEEVLSRTRHGLGQAAGYPSQRRRRRLGPQPSLLEAAALGVALVVGVVQRWNVLTGPLGYIDLDEATAGIAARSFFAEPSVFFPGQPYGGTPESVLVALVHQGFGSGTLQLKVVPIVLHLVACCLVWGAARRVVPSRAGQLAAPVLLWLGPAAGVWQSTKERGFYGAAIVAAALIVWLVARLDHHVTRSGGVTDDRAALTRRELVGLGLAMGVGWWISPLLLLVALPAVGWLLFRDPSRLDYWPRVLAGAVIGALPWIGWNVLHAFRSMRQPASLGTDAFTRFGDGVAKVAVLVGLETPWDPDRTLVPMARFVAVAILLVALVVAISRHPSTGASLPAVLVVGYLLLYPLANNTGTVGADPRYLYPMLPALALLIAGLVPSPRWLPSSVVVLVVAGLAAASTSWGMVGLDEVRTLDVRFLEAPGTSRVIDLLEDRDVRFAVTDLAGTQITYETGGRVKASSFAVPRFDDLECLMLVEQPSTYVLDNNLANNVANLEWYLATNEIPYTKQQIGTWTVVFAEEWVPPWEAGLGMLLGVVREPDCPAPGVAPG